MKAFPHLDGGQDPAEVDTEGRLADVEGVSEVEGHSHVPGAHRLLVHGFILPGGTGEQRGSLRFEVPNRYMMRDTAGQLVGYIVT